MSARSTQYATENGLIPREALGSLTINITNRDVTMSNRNIPTFCAAACALRRAGHEVVMVLDGTSWVQNGKYFDRYRNPPALTKAIRNFDKKKAVFPPGEYTLRPYSPSQTLVELSKKPSNKLKRSHKSTGKLTSRKRKVHLSLRRVWNPS